VEEGTKEEGTEEEGTEEEGTEEAVSDREEDVKISGLLVVKVVVGRTIVEVEAVDVMYSLSSSEWYSSIRPSLSSSESSTTPDEPVVALFCPAIKEGLVLDDTVSDGREVIDDPDAGLEDVGTIGSEDKRDVTEEEGFEDCDFPGRGSNFIPPRPTGPFCETSLLFGSGEAPSTPSSLLKDLESDGSTMLGT